MKKFAGIALFATSMLVGAAAHAGTVYNGTPADGWLYGDGNDYTPANTAVLTTDANDQLYLRMHKTFDNAPASDGSGVYSFALGTDPMSFDWGIDNNTDSSITANIIITNIGTGVSWNYNPLFIINDNTVGNGSTQNSYRLNWAGVGFDPGVNDTYKVELDVSGLTGGDQSLSVYAKLGTGAVPEPASWALMIAGFGLAGTAMRLRKRAVRFA